VSLAGLKPKHMSENNSILISAKTKRFIFIQIKPNIIYINFLKNKIIKIDIHNNDKQFRNAHTNMHLI